MLRRAIVTGASGFLGLALVEDLMHNGFEVAAVTHSESGAKTLKAQIGQAKVIICGYEDYKELPRILGQQYDYFFHLAWQGVSDSNHNSIELQLDNVIGAINAVRVASDLGCTRFIGAGSIHEIEYLYEEQLIGMQRPASCASHKPISPYKKAKFAACGLCESEARQRGIEFIWPRVTNAYGPGENSARLINSAIRDFLEGKVKNFTDATQLYNFIYVEDAAKAFRLIAEHGFPSHRYLVGSSDVRQLRDFLIEVGDIIGFNANLGIGVLRDSGVHLPQEFYSNRMLVEDTGFQESISFAEGVARTRDWILRNG